MKALEGLQTSPESNNSEIEYNIAEVNRCSHKTTSILGTAVY